LEVSLIDEDDKGIVERRKGRNRDAGSSSPTIAVGDDFSVLRCVLSTESGLAGPLSLSISEPCFARDNKKKLYPAVMSMVSGY